MKLLIDMNLSPRWTSMLADNGFSAVHWSTVGRADADDREIMAEALRSGAIVVTHDLDFGAILAASGEGGPSVIQLRADDVRPEQAGTALAAALRQCEAELAEGALVTVDAGRHRVTLLPLRR